MTEPQQSIPTCPTVVLVEAKEGEVPRLRGDIPDWNWVVAPEQWAGDVERLDGASPDGIVVYAQRDREDEAFDLCQRIRESESLEGVPLLVAINMYQLFLGNKVRRLPNSHFVITPVAKDSLEERLAELGTSAQEGN